MSRNEEKAKIPKEKERDIKATKEKGLASMVEESQGAVRRHHGARMANRRVERTMEKEKERKERRVRAKEGVDYIQRHVEFVVSMAIGETSVG